MIQLVDKSLRLADAIQNIGIIDRMARITLGMVMISMWFLYPIGSVSMWFALLPLLGIFPLLTGIMGWCPTYAFFHTRSCGMDENNTCGTFPDQLQNLFRHTHH